MSFDNTPESLRLKYLYRKLIQRGRIKLPHYAAAKLIGPDCAYHLYSSYKEKDNKKKKP